MSDSDPESPVREGARLAANRRFVRTIANWAAALSVLIVLYDVAVLRRYPFPHALEVVRAPFYTIIGAALVIGALFCAFLGYRIISLRYARRTRAIYVIFFPLVLLICSLFWLIGLS